MLNLIHQIVFNENKVKKSSNQYNLQKTIDLEEISCLNNHFKLFHYFFSENLTMQNFENAPFHIMSVCDVLKIPALYPCRRIVIGSLLKTDCQL